MQRPEVARGGGAALLPRGAVVEVAALGGPGAGGEAAGLVAGDDVLGQLRRRQVPLAAEVEDHTRGRVGEDPPPDTVRGDPPRGLGGDGAVAVQVGGLVVGADQRRIGHRHVHTGRLPAAGTEPGVDVCAARVAAAQVPGGQGGPAQPGEHVRACLVQGPLVGRGGALLAAGGGVDGGPECGGVLRG
ncbi:MAG TPA: hypothetical protein VK585_09630 [Jiangellaceae bacterium]|nr:hypothetical protein [Jiangellaceae bacterium]